LVGIKVIAINRDGTDRHKLRTILKLNIILRLRFQDLIYLIYLKYIYIDFTVIIFVCFHFAESKESSDDNKRLGGTGRIKIFSQFLN